MSSYAALFSDMSSHGSRYEAGRITTPTRRTSPRQAQPLTVRLRDVALSPIHDATCDLGSMTEDIAAPQIVLQ